MLLQGLYIIRQNQDKKTRHYFSNREKNQENRFQEQDPRNSFKTVFKEDMPIIENLQQNRVAET